MTEFWLPYLAHSGLTGLGASRGFADNQTDVSFSFCISTDSTLIKNNLGTRSLLFTVGPDDMPLVGLMQNPRLIPTTFILEDFTTKFADTTEALIPVLSGDESEAVLRVTGYPEGEVKPGELFDLTMGVEGAYALRTYEYHLDFDPQPVAVVDLVSNGELFSNYITDMGCKLERGRVGLVNSILGQTPVGASGSASLATMRFQAVGRAVEIAFNVTDGLLINVEYIGSSPQTGDPVMVVLSKDPIVYHAQNGSDIQGLIMANEDPVVDFDDFIAFAGSFNLSFGESP